MNDAIASLRNPLIKEIRKAVAQGTLTAGGCAIAESFHLLEEAIHSRCSIPEVICTEKARTRLDRYAELLYGTRISVFPEESFRQISTTEASQGVIALVRPRDWTVDSLFGPMPLVVVLDGVQDPGNAGTIVRSAEAFGASGVLFLKGSVNPFNAKTLRASSGSLFRLPVVSGYDDEPAIADLARRNVKLYAAVPKSDRQIGKLDFTKPCALLVGGEGSGIRPPLRRVALECSIPTMGVESLNAAIAASVILYEADRQRRLSGTIAL